MKYGESLFDILYLLFAIIVGIIIIVKSKTKITKAMGISSVVLGLGDAFHLVPRVLNYFIESNFSVALGVGKLITSITMTLFYLNLFYIWILEFKEQYNVKLSIVITSLAVVRVILCLFPQNGWFDNSNNLFWSILRNIPFVILGAIICYLFYKHRKDNTYLRETWLYILLSFVFYIPVATIAQYVPILGMLMLPKTICYILMIVSFILYTRNEKVLAE